MFRGFRVVRGFRGFKGFKETSGGDRGRRFLLKGSIRLRVEDSFKGNRRPSDLLLKETRGGEFRAYRASIRLL